jgi:hypothetical protein
LCGHFRATRPGAYGDIGPDGRADGSRFHAAEQEAIAETGASKVTLKKFANGETVGEMRARIGTCRGT